MSKMTRRVCAILVAVVFLLPAYAFAQPGLAKAMQTKDRHTPALFRIPGVVATGVSTDQNGTAIVKVFTDRANLRNVPIVIDGVNVEYVFSGSFSALNNLGVKQEKKLGDVVAQRPPGGNGNGNGNNNGGGGVSPRDAFDLPVPIGVSIGSFPPNLCFAGTLGCRLKASNGSVYVLSNNHVLADENRNPPGSTDAFQPGALDTNCSLAATTIIGSLSSFVNISFDGSPNFVDAAIATTTTGQTSASTPVGEAYGTPTKNVATATVGMRVVKYGRTTGFTYGKVDSINVSVDVGYDQGTALFVNQVVIRGTRPNGRGNSTFSAGGDSGSLIVQLNSNDPVGLLFAGNSSYTIANPIQKVLDSFSGSGTTFTIDDGN